VPEPDDECEKMQWLLKHKSNGLTLEQVTDFTRMAAALCTVTDTPCPEFTDPRDVCTQCNGALEDTLEPTPALSACLSTINWACHTGPSGPAATPDDDVRANYDFCSRVPAIGWKATDKHDPLRMSAADLAALNSWWATNCASRVNATTPTVAAYTAVGLHGADHDAPVVGADEVANTALHEAGISGNLKAAQSKRNLRLLGMQPAPVPPLRDHTVERAALAALMRSLAAARSCDAALQSSVRRLVDTVLCEHGQRC